MNLLDRTASQRQPARLSAAFGHGCKEHGYLCDYGLDRKETQSIAVWNPPVKSKKNHISSDNYKLSELIFCQKNMLQPRAAKNLRIWTY